MDRNTLLWTLVVFFGASILFGAIANATSDEGAGVRIALQVGALVLVIVAIVVYVRRQR